MAALAGRGVLCSLTPPSASLHFLSRNLLLGTLHHINHIPEDIGLYAINCLCTFLYTFHDIPVAP